MFILFIILLTLPLSVSVHEVNKYSTYDDCNTKALSLTKEFRLAYPNDQDYAFVCLKGKE